MNNQVLARKWRPQRFAEVVGQTHVLTALTNGLAMKRVHHAYLFSGTRGVGKTSIARLLAKGLNCEQGVTAEPCGVCGACQEIAQGRFVDLIEIDAASRTKVEDTRELLDNVQYAPARGRYKVYLIDEVHMLSRHSFNALLKTLEEPPEHVKFLLATTEPQKLPITVLSRCLQLHLKALDIELLVLQLEKILITEGVVYENNAVNLLARLADGSMRDALSLADQAIALGQGTVSAEVVSQMLGLLDQDQALYLLEVLAKGDGEQLMQCIDTLAMRGIEWENTLIEILTLLHKISILQLVPSYPKNIDPEAQHRLAILAKVISAEDIQVYYQIALIGRKELAYAPDKRMGVEMTFLRMLAFRPDNNLATTSSIASNDRLPKPQPSVTHFSHYQDEGIVDPIQADEKKNNPVSRLLKAKALLKQSKNQLEHDIEPKAERLQLKSITPGTMEAGPRVKNMNPILQETSTPQQQRVQDVDEYREASYQWKATTNHTTLPQQTTLKPSDLGNLFSDQKSPELLEKINYEAEQRDPWSYELQHLTIPRLVKQLAMNCYKELLSDDHICLHLRSTYRHLNSEAGLKALEQAFTSKMGKKITVTIIEDDNKVVLTPMEWKEQIYQEKIIESRQAIQNDPQIQKLCQMFNAVLDEESIRPV